MRAAIAARARRIGSLAWRGAKRAADAGARTGGDIVKSLPDGRRIYDLVPVADPPPPRGFFYIAHVGLELIHRIEQRSIFVLPGGVAFFLLLGLLPAAAALASLYGLIADPAELAHANVSLQELLPAPAALVISETFARIAAAPASTLGIGAAIALFTTLMSANWATKAMSEALNIIVDRRETRNYFEFTGVTLLLTTLAVMIGGVYAWLLFRISALATAGAQTSWLLTAIEAVSISVILALMIGVLYRYAPAPEPAETTPTPLFSAGSITASLAIIALSWVMAGQFTNTATFVRNFGPLASTAAVVVWGWMIIVVILLGAEINEIRRQEAAKIRKKKSRWPSFRGR